MNLMIEQKLNHQNIDLEKKREELQKGVKLLDQDNIIYLVQWLMSIIIQENKVILIHYINLFNYLCYIIIFD